MTESVLCAPEAEAPQRFHWLRFSWDIARMLTDLAAGELTPRQVQLPSDFISAYAKRVLMLRADRVADPAFESPLVSMATTRALALPDQALRTPVLVVHGPQGIGMFGLDAGAPSSLLLADGQHRMAKAYFTHASELPAWVLSQAESDRYLTERRPRTEVRARPLALDKKRAAQG